MPDFARTYDSWNSRRVFSCTWTKNSSAIFKVNGVPISNTFEWFWNRPYIFVEKTKTKNETKQTCPLTLPFRIINMERHITMITQKLIYYQYNIIDVLFPLIPKYQNKYLTLNCKRYGSQTLVHKEVPCYPLRKPLSHWNFGIILLYPTQ